eukprot:355251-Chlamydomonas_euryale.AAC.2
MSHVSALMPQGPSRVGDGGHVLGYLASAGNAECRKCGLQKVWNAESVECRKCNSWGPFPTHPCTKPPRMRRMLAVTPTSSLCWTPWPQVCGGLFPPVLTRHRSRNTNVQDADEDGDGQLTFEDFLTSYARERPVLMTMAVLLVHTACFWAIFNLQLDTFLKLDVFFNGGRWVWNVGCAVLACAPSPGYSSTRSSRCGKHWVCNGPVFWDIWPDVWGGVARRLAGPASCRCPVVASRCSSPP